MMKKLILDLCGGTGSWSAPYLLHGYDVRIITLPDYDVLTYEPPQNVYGVLAAPPCTHFSIACNRLWSEKDRTFKTYEGLELLFACLRIIEKCNPVFWAIENPVGRMKEFLGNPQYSFYFTDFGFPCSKRSYLWGRFNKPEKENHSYEKIYKLEELDYKIPELRDVPGVIKTDHGKRAAVRSITPVGFANAFFRVNQ